MQNIDNHETKTSAGSSLQEHQAMLEKLLYAFSDVCEQNNIPFQLYAGTLLGAVRHKYLCGNKQSKTHRKKEKLKMIQRISKRLISLLLATAMILATMKQWSCRWRLCTTVM